MVWSAAVVAEEALRTIGAFSPYDEEPDPEDFDIALRRLDSLVSYLVATEGLWFFQEIEQEITLTANTRAYNINALLTTPLQYISSVFRTYNDGDRTEVDMLRVNKYEEKRANEPNLSIPDYVYIEREIDGNLFIWGVPTVSGYKLQIRGRRFSGELLTDNGATRTEFTKAWNLCLVDLLAYNIGSGPVLTLPDGKLSRLKTDGLEKKNMLIAYNQKENVKEPRYTEFNEF